MYLSRTVQPPFSHRPDVSHASSASAAIRGEQYRLKAREMDALAEHAKDPAVRISFLALSLQYELLADRVPSGSWLAAGEPLG